MNESEIERIRLMDWQESQTRLVDCTQNQMRTDKIVMKVFEGSVEQVFKRPPRIRMYRMLRYDVRLSCLRRDCGNERLEDEIAL